MGWVQILVNSPGRDNGDHSYGSFGDPGPDGSGFPVVVVPDDISALDDEVRAYRREVARAKARAKCRSALTRPLRALAGLGRRVGHALRFLVFW
ncbi:hypothetical protein ABH935_006857 [Catenulispora sp. GAS73]